MKSRIAALLASIGLSTAAFAWTPPDKPDLRQVLQEAQADRIAGRYQEALEKHLWFHRRALQIDASYSAVRLSFNIGDWHALGRRYAPAMAALRNARAEAFDDVQAGRNMPDAFHDLASIDRELEELEATQAVFRALEARNPAQARRAFYFARSSLIELQDYATVARYIDASRELEAERFALQHENTKVDKRLAGHVNQMLLRRAGENVAILVLAGRAADAKLLHDKALALRDDAEMRAIMARAMEGHLPAPLFDAAARKTMRALTP